MGVTHGPGIRIVQSHRSPTKTTRSWWMLVRTRGEFAETARREQHRMSNSVIGRRMKTFSLDDALMKRFGLGRA